MNKPALENFRDEKLTAARPDPLKPIVDILERLSAQQKRTESTGILDEASDEKAAA